MRPEFFSERGTPSAGNMLCNAPSEEGVQPFDFFFCAASAKTEIFTKFGFFFRAAAQSAASKPKLSRGLFFLLPLCVCVPAALCSHSLRDTREARTAAGQPSLHRPFDPDHHHPLKLRDRIVSDNELSFPFYHLCGSSDVSSLVHLSTATAIAPLILSSRI